MAAPLIADRHLPHFHRRGPVKESVRVATTANITLSGTQTIDGVTVIAEDRVLVTNETTASSNGIYRCQSGAWIRDYDESSDDPSFGYLVLVREGTANGGTLWKNTNTSTPTIGSTSLTFANALSSVSLALDDLTDVVITSATLADRLRFDGSVWRNSALIWQPLTDPSVPDLIFDTGTGDVIMTEA